MSKRALLSVLCFSLCACTSLQARQPAPVQNRVVVFKDGHALVVRKISATEDAAGKLHIEQLPDQATLGTFWLVDPEHDIAWIQSQKETEEFKSHETVTCQNVFEILKANLGQQVSLLLENQEILAGRVQAVLPQRQDASGIAGNWFVLASTEGQRMLAVSSVKQVLADELKLQVTVEKKSKQSHKTLTVAYRKPKPGRRHTLWLSYFRPDLRWIPSYRLNILSNREVLVEMQAELINEAEDLESMLVELAVGKPTFRFQNVISPMVLEQNLKFLISQVAPQLGNQAFDNSMFRARAGERVYRPNPLASFAGADADLGGAQEDLYFYSAGVMSLKKGARALIPLAKSQVPARHVYTWRLDAHGPSTPASTAGRELGENKVWHQMELTNTTGAPWTSGPALWAKNGRVLGQDLMTYTPAGGKTRLPITMAVGLRGQSRVEEISRKHNAKQVNGRRYTEITRKIHWQVQSSLGKKVQLEIEAAFDGQCREVSGDGKYQLIPPPFRTPLSFKTQVFWPLKLAAQGSQEGSAICKHYVRE